jgi:hypothetical protein
VVHGRLERRRKEAYSAGEGMTIDEFDETSE